LKGSEVKSQWPTSPQSVYPSPFMPTGSATLQPPSYLQNISKTDKSIPPRITSATSLHSDMCTATDQSVGNIQNIVELPALDEAVKAIDLPLDRCASLGEQMACDGFCAIELSDSALSQLRTFFSEAPQTALSGHESEAVVAKCTLDVSSLAKPLTKLANQIHIAASKYDGMAKFTPMLKPHTLELKRWRAQQGAPNFHNDQGRYRIVMCLTVQGTGTTEFVSKKNTRDLMMQGNSVTCEDGSPVPEDRVERSKPNELLIFRGAAPSSASENDIRPDALVHRSPPNAGERTIGLFRFTGAPLAAPVQLMK